MENGPYQNSYYNFFRDTHSARMPALRDGPRKLSSSHSFQQGICTRYLTCSPLFSPRVDLSLALSREPGTSSSDEELERLAKNSLQKGFGMVPIWKELRLRWRRSSREELPTSKVKGGSQEELPHVQGKEQRLCFSGAAVKRYPMSKVRETQVRWQALREGIRGQTD